MLTNVLIGYSYLDLGSFLHKIKWLQTYFQVNIHSYMQIRG
jgi:hypothetical protein